MELPATQPKRALPSSSSSFSILGQNTMGTSPHHHQLHGHTSHILSKKLMVTRVIYVLIPLALLHLYLCPSTFKSAPTPSSHVSGAEARKTEADGRLSPRRCDYADGQWVADPRGPQYNGTSCSTIKPGQNCQAHGRADTGYLHWRWRPSACGFPRFDPAAFLRLIADKHIAFIGDSMARNQLESLLCLLAAASPPELVYRNGNDSKFRRWVFRSHNATVSVFWSPFLVEGVEKSAAAGLNHNKLYLDSADKRWAKELAGIDVTVFSAGHWFLHPAVFYEDGGVVGCHHCPEKNHTETGFFGVFRKAVRTTLKEVSAGAGEKYAVVTTFSPAHFDGEWDKAGACARKEPYGEGEKEMEYMDGEMRRIVVEEVEAAAAERSGGGVRMEVLDVTRMAMMRADGHPGPYMNPNPFEGGPKERVQNDCVHWCLPGPIDAWNEILLQMMRRWRGDVANRGRNVRLE